MSHRRPEVDLHIAALNVEIWPPHDRVVAFLDLLTATTSVIGDWTAVAGDIDLVVSADGTDVVVAFPAEAFGRTYEIWYSDKPDAPVISGKITRAELQSLPSQQSVAVSIYTEVLPTVPITVYTTASTVGVVNATGIATYDSGTQTIHVPMPTAGDVGADPAGTAAGLVDDLSGVSNQATARTNLGLGTAAVEAATAFATSAQGSTADSAVQPGDLHAVATTGDYGDLINTPAVPPPAPVDSVNGETGVVVLDAADVGAAPTSRTITAGTGLTGGGDLSANRTLAVSYGATAGTAAQGNDSRLSDARTPTAHAASHAIGGADPLDAADVDAVPITAVGLLAGETNRGDWSGATAYVVGDVVHDHAEGQVYVCTAANTNEQPSLTPAKWTAIDGTGRTLALGPGGSAGLFAASLGYGAEAGAGGTAIGYGVSAPGVGATAVGYIATAAGAAATAAGSTAAAGGDSSTAVGANATSPGDYSTAIGYGATAPTDGDVNIANILTGHIDTGTGQADEPVTVAYGAIDLPETVDATNPAADSLRFVARAGGMAVRDETGAESQIALVDNLTGYNTASDTAPVAPATGDGWFNTATGRQYVWTGAVWIEVGVEGIATALSGKADIVHATRHQNGGADELALDGSQITTGTVATARLGSGSASSATFLRGDQAWAAPDGIPATIIDAAGDLIVGTADNTVGRLALGPSGQVLTSNGTTAAWAAPSLPSLTFTAAAYYTLGGNESIHSSVSPDTVGAMTAHPVWLDAGSYDRETVTVTVAAVSTWRLGVFADSGSLSPGARLLDAGALNMNSGTGARELSVTITIPTSGIYWLALLVDAYTARPTSCGWMGATGGTPNLPWVGHRGIMNPGGRGSWAARATGVATGAIPATFPGGHSWTDTTPQIALRRV